MASPQLEDGYTRIANELLEELCRFPMGGPHFRIAIWILRFTYGWEGRKTMRFNMAEIGRGVGMDRGNVRRTIQELGQMNVLKLDGKTIGINKDWESWRLHNVVEVTTKKDSNGVKLTTSMESVGPQKCSQADPLYKERKKYKDITPISPLKTKNKTAVPEEFPIHSNILIWIQKKLGDIPIEFIEFERDAFLDRHASLGSKFISWEAAFRTWMRNWYFKFGGKEKIESKVSGITLEQATKESYERRHGLKRDG